MLTLRQLLKALNQVAIDREDLLDKPIIGDLTDLEGIYHNTIGIVDVSNSLVTQAVKMVFVED